MGEAQADTTVSTFELSGHSAGKELDTVLGGDGLGLL